MSATKPQNEPPAIEDATKPGFKGEGPEVDSQGVVEPRHAAIGLENRIGEHEDERLNPGQQGGSATGAPPGGPGDPSNSA